MLKIAIYGGSFSPITIAHEYIINTLLKNYILVVVPSGNRSDKNLIDFDFRIKFLKKVF